MTTWEYLKHCDPGSDLLEEIGAAGWELAGIAGDVWVFKRPTYVDPRLTQGQIEEAVRSGVERAEGYRR